MDNILNNDTYMNAMQKYIWGLLGTAAFAGAIFLGFHSMLSLFLWIGFSVTSSEVATTLLSSAFGLAYGIAAFLLAQLTLFFWSRIH